MIHHYHSTEGNTDLAAIRTEANARTQNNTKYGLTATDSVIHFHRHEEKCDPLGQHEWYAVPPLAPIQVAMAYWKNFLRNIGGEYK